MSKASDLLRSLAGSVGIGAPTVIPSIPTVPTTGDANVDQFLSALKQTIETWAGERGDSLDSAVTWRGLIDKQFATIDLTEGTPGSGNGFLPIRPREVSDLTPPPAPQNLVASGALSTIILDWDTPTYGNHAYTEIWRSGTPVIGTAERIGMAPGAVYADSVGGGSTYYYWIRFVSTADVSGPYNRTDGTIGQTSLDPGYLLDVLNGQISESELAQNLSGRINLIDAPATTPGSVSAKVKTETDARVAADSALSSSISSLSSTVTGNYNTLNSAIQTEATTRANADSALTTQINTVQASFKATQLGLPLDQWVLGNQTIVTLSDGKVGSKALRLSGNASYPNQGTYIPIDRTKKYRVRFWARPSANAAGLLYFSLRQFLNDSGSAGPVNGGRSPYKPNAVTRTAHLATYGDTWGEYSFVWSDSDWQTGVKFVLPEFLDNYSGAAGYWDIQDFTFAEVTALEGNSAAIQTLATTTAGPDGATAQYTVKTDVNGYVSGFGLSNTYNNASPFSQFIFKADQFAFGAPGLTTAYPFVIQASATTVNGVTVPAGVYIDAAYIKNGTITNAKIGNAAIDSAKIADAAIVTAKIADANITAAKIADANITNAKIANAAIDSAKIADAAITNAKIDNASITEAKIADANITSAKIANAAITAAKIADANITAAKIADGNITNAKIQDGAITNAKIADAQITAAKIADAAITTAKIGNAAINEAKIGDLEVSTIKVKNNAITNGASVYSHSSPTSVGITTNGGVVYVWAEFLVPNGNYTINLTRDGAVISQKGYSNTEVGANYSFMARDIPSAGYHTYGISVSGEWSSGPVYYITLLTLEVKK